MDNIFSFDFTRWEVYFFYLVPAMINFVLFAYAIIVLPKNKTNFSFATFVLFIGLWQFSEGLMRLSVLAETAKIWYCYMGLIAVFITPLGFHFTINYNNIKSRWKNHILIFTQYLPALIFAILILAKQDTHQIVQSDNWYWLFNPIPNPVTNSIYLWISLNGLTILFILAYQYFISKSGSTRKKQTLLLLIGFMCPLFGGLFFEVAFPFVLERDIIPVTTSLFTAFSLSSLIAIVRYNIFEYSPRQNWEHILESINEGILILNNEHCIMYTNDALRRLLGYNQEAVYGLHEKMFYVDRDAFEGLLNTEVFQNDQSSQMEFQIKAACGKFNWMIVSRSPYLDYKNNVIGVICIFTSIDGQKRAEMALKEDKERLKLAIDSGKMITIDVDYINDKVLYSENVKALLGIDTVGLDIKNSIDTNIHPDDKMKIKVAMEKMISEGELSDLQFRLIRPDNGELVWLERRGDMLFDSKGKCIGFKGVLLDITHIKEAEISLQKLLDITKDQNERLQNFTYIVSHNIRSHSANISGLVALLKEENNAEEFIMLDRSASMLSDTIDNLNEIITFQRDAGNNLHNISLKKEIDNTMEAISALIKSSEFELINKINEDTQIYSVPSYLESILLNLFTNAIKYRHPDRKPKLIIDMKMDENYTVLSFKDNGLGIDLEKFGKDLFGMYKTFHNHSDSKGIGLFITRNQVEAMNGKIEVESEPGKGSNFIIYFANQKENAAKIN